MWCWLQSSQQTVAQLNELVHSLRVVDCGLIASELMYERVSVVDKSEMCVCRKNGSCVYLLPHGPPPMCFAL